jgi:hypothetical protein
MIEHMFNCARLKISNKLKYFRSRVPALTICCQRMFNFPYSSCPVVIL